MLTHPCAVQVDKQASHDELHGRQPLVAGDEDGGARHDDLDEESHQFNPRGQGVGAGVR